MCIRDRLKIEYRASAGELSSNSPSELWQTVPVQLDQKIQSQSWADQLAWWPDTSASQLEVRIRINDLAGNESTASRYIAVKRASWRTRSTGSTLGQARPPRNPYQAVNNSAANSEGSAAWQPKLKPLVNGNPQPGQAPERAVVQLMETGGE